MRSLTSKDDLYQLMLDTPLREQTSYEATSIPEATIELQLENETMTTLSATGEIGY